MACVTGTMSMEEGDLSETEKVDWASDTLCLASRGRIRVRVKVWNQT